MTTTPTTTLRHELRRAQRDGITTTHMPNPTDTALAGYLAGIRHAIFLVNAPNTPRQSANTPPSLAELQDAR
jgi:hypothetical protein